MIHIYQVYFMPEHYMRKYVRDFGDNDAARSAQGCAETQQQGSAGKARGVVCTGVHLRCACDEFDANHDARPHVAHVLDLDADALRFARDFGDVRTSSMDVPLVFAAPRTD